jgi:hypothetical protein
MLAVVGTIPEECFPLVSSEIHLDNGRIRINGSSFPVNRGTPALLAAAIRTCEVLGRPSPVGHLAGDIGLGDGSRRLYRYLTENLGNSEINVVTFHYLQPDVDWHNRIIFSLEEMAYRPILIADAGFMYAAKMSGQSKFYDLFTPDVGEMAFLADEKAPHPFYTRGFILHEEDRVPELIERAYSHQNAARCLLVKGKRDYIADRDGIEATIDQPREDSMEAIGGTGDTLTGIVTALVDSGIMVKDAAITASKVNRLAGALTRPTPATQVIEIISKIPQALEIVLNEYAEQP